MALGIEEILLSQASENQRPYGILAQGTLKARFRSK